MNPLFQTPLSRAKLLALPRPQTDQRISVAVHRNHSFELVASAINPFLALCGAQAEFCYGGYDDSLSFASPLPKANLHLIWVDAARYFLPDFPAWLRSRAISLRDASGAGVIVACCGADCSNWPDQTSLADILYLNCDAVLASLGAKAFDARLEPFSGTRLSDQACLVLARELGTRQIPALLFPPLKLLALDLDNTLHAGVLGEDGPESLVPSLDLQRCLADLKQQGFLLALVSKNDEEDVRRLFAARPDYPLRWEDFSAHALGWKPKAEGIASVAKSLGLGLDSVLFLDDNPGERLAVTGLLPEVHVLPADTPGAMLAALRHYPGLYRTRFVREDVLRRADLAANTQRNRLRRELAPEDYIARLGIVLDVAVNDPQGISRVTDLLRKTNQFNLSLVRPRESDVAAYASDTARCVVSISMKDSLSDSGLIAAGLFRTEGAILYADALAVSCRALGRGVEDGMLRTMLQVAARHLASGEQVAIAYVRGPRNQPALDWLPGLIGEEVGEKGIVMLPALPAETLRGISIRKSEV